MTYIKRQKIQLRSHLEICLTVLIFIAGVALLCWTQNVWIRLLGACVMLISQIRMMFISHDIGHRILFNNDNYNRLWSILIGGISGSPIECKSRGHHFHHLYNGNLVAYNGPLLIISKQEFNLLSDRQKLTYRATRHWSVLWFTSLMRYALIPQLRLLKGWIETKKREGHNILVLELLNQSRILKQSRREMIDTLGATAIWIIILVMSYYLNIIEWYIINLVISFCLTDILFHAQHNFSDSYASMGTIWEYEKAIEYGTCNFKFNRVGHWITANIGMHQAHHKIPNVPFFKLNSIDKKLRHEKYYKAITTNQILDSRYYLLWDAAKMKHCRCID